MSLGELQKQLITRARGPRWHQDGGGRRVGGGVERAPPPLLFLGLLFPGSGAVRGGRQRRQVLSKPTQIWGTEPFVEPLGRRGFVQEDRKD